jgi:hypothetical protein
MNSSNSASSTNDKGASPMGPLLSTNAPIFPFQRHKSDEAATNKSNEEVRETLEEKDRLQVRTEVVTNSSQRKARIGVVLGDEDVATESVEGLPRR